MTSQAPRRRSAAGLVIAAAMALALAGALWPTARVVGGAAGWLAVALLWPDIAGRARVQALVLTALGGAGLAWGAAHGVPADWARALGANAPLIGLLAAVSFLRLVAGPPEGTAERRPERQARTGGPGCTRVLRGPGYR